MGEGMTSLAKVPRQLSRRLNEPSVRYARRDLAGRWRTPPGSRGLATFARLDVMKSPAACAGRRRQGLGRTACGKRRPRGPLWGVTNRLQIELGSNSPFACR